MWTAVSSSTGMLKKPWIWPWWRSIVSTRSAPGDGDHVGDEPGGDRDARLVLLVRPAVRVVRDDGGDPAGARPLERVDHDQQFHDRLVDRVAGRLDEEDVLLADVLEDLDEDVLVGELEDLQLARLRAEIARRSSGPGPGSSCRCRSRTGPRTSPPPPVRRRPRRPSCRPHPPVPGVVGLAPSPPGSPSSPMPSCSASPARNAAMATTRSPSARRMTITPRAPDE